MNKQLNEVQIEDIRKLASNVRLSLGLGDDIPIANDMFSILDRKDITLVEYPISVNGKPGFYASLTCFNTNGNKLFFLGLNTANPLDAQIFGIAHELYHYETNTIDLPDNSSEEIKADRFAAELLLPLSSLRAWILKEFKVSSLQSVSKARIMRFIARLQCEWWLPYRSLVRRLYEEDYISSSQYDQLYSNDERSCTGEYGRICCAIDKDVFERLNSPTNRTGTSPRALETVIGNYEDGLIDVDNFIRGMRLLGKAPEDFSLDIEIDPEDIDEMNAYLGEGETDKTFKGLTDQDQREFLNFIEEK